MNSILFGQQIKSIELEEIEIDDNQVFYFPKFTPDAENLLLTKSNQQGIWIYNLENQLLDQINNDMGAGFSPVFSGDNAHIIFRKDTYKNRKKYSSIFAYNLETKKEIMLEQENRYLAHPSKTTSGEIVYKKKNNFISYDQDLSRKSESFNGKLIDTSEPGLILYENGNPVILDESTENNYLWASLSPDQSKILYTKAGYGTYISDLKGNFLADLGYANAAVWSPDGNWIAYMVDRDNGYYYTESEIYISSKDGMNKYQVTETENEIEMYPQWAPESRQIVFHTTTGSIKIARLKME
jgi:Tol biopolymer transport system component